MMSLKEAFAASEIETPTKRYLARDGKYYNGYCASPDWAEDSKGDVYARVAREVTADLERLKEMNKDYEGRK